MSSTLRLLAALTLVALAWLAYREIGVAPDAEPAPVSDDLAMPDVSGLPPLELVSSDDCAACHQDIYDEWKGSHHWYSWLNPEPRRKELSDNFRNKDCIPCHAPRPMLEVGFGKRPLEREDRREDGVNCFTCHKFQNAMLTANSLSPAASNAPCQPVTWEPVAEMRLCSPCHDQHKVEQDWRRSRFAVEGPSYQDCNDCHMPWMEGPPTKGSSRTKHRGHAFHGAHDPAMLKSAGTFRALRVAADRDMSEAIVELSGREFDPGEKADGSRRVLIEVTNSGTGHNLPADERHRAVDVYARFVPESGLPGPEIRLTRFRNPYRHEFDIVNPFKERAGEVLRDSVAEKDLELELAQVRLLPLFNPDRKVFYEDSTQLAAGETRLIWFDLPELGPGRLELRLYYKLQPYMSNADAVTMAAIDLDF